jgi:putative ATPase
MKELSYGATYKYSHDYPHNFAEQEFLPEKLSKTRLWTPQGNAQEAKLRERMEFLWKRKYQ